MAASTAPDSMNQPPAEASPSAAPSSSQQYVIKNAKMVIVGDQNVMKTKDTSCPQVNSDTGSDSSRPTSPSGPREDDYDYVTSKTRTLIALCSTKDIPVRFLLMIVKFALNKVPSPQDSYRSQIKDSFDLDFDPFEACHQNKCFKIPRKCNKLVKDILGSTESQKIARKEGILNLAELYNKIFCVEDDEEWHLQQQLLPHLDKWFSLVEENGLNSSLRIDFLTMCLHAFGKFRWTGWEDRLNNLCEKCLEHCKDASDQERERMLREIGETYRKLCDHTKAEEYLTKALNIHKNPCPDSLPYQISRMFFARCKIDMGEYQAAHELMKDCLDSEAVKNLKQKRPYLRCRMSFEMARSCEKLGKFGDAYQYCSKALEDDRREEGFRYPQYLMYAAFYKAMSTTGGNVSEQRAVLNDALADCSKADSILRERHGEDHHHRAHVLCIQARIWLSRNDPKEALRRARRACHITNKRYGYEHIKVAKMFDLLGDIHKDLGNLEKAWEAYWMAKNMYSAGERQHSRADDIEQKLANMPEFKGLTPKHTKSELFDELLV